MLPGRSRDWSAYPEFGVQLIVSMRVSKRDGFRNHIDSPSRSKFARTAAWAPLFFRFGVAIPLGVMGTTRRVFVAVDIGMICQVVVGGARRLDAVCIEGGSLIEQSRRLFNMKMRTGVDDPHCWCCCPKSGAWVGYVTILVPPTSH